MTENEITETIIGHVVVLKNGIKRLVNEYSGPPISSPRESPDLRVSAVKEKVH